MNFIELTKVEEQIDRIIPTDTIYVANSSIDFFCRYTCRNKFNLQMEKIVKLKKQGKMNEEEVPTRIHLISGGNLIVAESRAYIYSSCSNFIILHKKTMIGNVSIGIAINPNQIESMTDCGNYTLITMKSSACINVKESTETIMNVMPK